MLQAQADLHKIPQGSILPHYSASVFMFSQQLLQVATISVLHHNAANTSQSAWEKRKRNARGLTLASYQSRSSPHICKLHSKPELLLILGGCTYFVTFGWSSASRKWASFRAASASVDDMSFTRTSLITTRWRLSVARHAKNAAPNPPRPSSLMRLYLSAMLLSRDTSFSKAGRACAPDLTSVLGLQPSL
jgi:hypothetical protein